MTLEDEFSCYARDKVREWLIKKSVPPEAADWAASANIIVTGNTWRPADEGRSAVIVPVMDGVVVDLVAWLPGKPDRWYLRRGTNSVLGWHDLRHAIVYGRPIRVHATPFDWLLSGLEGCVPLTQEAGVHFLGCVKTTGCVKIGEAIVAELKRQYVFPEV